MSDDKEFHCSHSKASPDGKCPVTRDPFHGCQRGAECPIIQKIDYYHWYESWERPSAVIINLADYRARRGK